MFEIENVTKHFYDRFQKEHAAFLKFILGFEVQSEREWYASLMLNRLMFIYFIQKRGFLDHDTDYLRHRLQRFQPSGGTTSRSGNSQGFYHQFLLRLFHEGLGQQSRSPELTALLGEVPYLKGSLFDLHQLELNNSDIQIPDEAFERIFAFFDLYNWHLDECPLNADNEINPHVLGYIFEKYINQAASRTQMGAYYTKEDITEYISKNTIIPFLFDKVGVEAENVSVWQLLRAHPERYIYPAVQYGIKTELPPEIAIGLTEVSKRSEWNKAAPSNYALPTEIWREVVARRKHYAEIYGKLVVGEIYSINGLITYNLNICQFAQDVVENCTEALFLWSFYQALANIKVLDPTCGSGAFLFAALNLLELLYEACLERMQLFVFKSKAHEIEAAPIYKNFEDLLQIVAHHPNRRYFILKTILTQNLYGVDIMVEAVEIAKLRLFLKLVAQVEKVEQLEPLPDIDFNLRVGNTLVGFATVEEAKTAFKCQFDFERATSKHKQGVQLAELQAELDRYLAGEYGIDPHHLTKEGEYEAKLKEWRTSHLPFHWFVEFYSIMTQGGFDVIIGNPPYVEYKTVLNNYTVKNYGTEECGNLYAFVMERSLVLKTSAGRCGMIVPMSGHSTNRMQGLVKQFYDKASLLHLMNISGDAHPSVLFPGVKFRLAIFLYTCTGKGKTIFTTRYTKWFHDEREALFSSNLIYTPLADRPYSLIPKISGTIHRNLMTKLLQTNSEFGLQSGGKVIYYHNAPVSWIRAHPFIPYFYSERDGEKASTQLKPLYFYTETQALAASGLLCSSLFFIWWITTSDCYHLNKREIEHFPLSLSDTQLTSRLAEISKLLIADFKANSKRRVYVYKTSGRVEYDEFYPKLSKPLIDQIDLILAQHYGFTEEELDFILNYDIKYRMGVTNQPTERHPTNPDRDL
ncbi:MAG: DNA methyltransferase [Chloroflexota bacterium]